MNGAYLETAAAGAPYLFFGVVLGFLLACFVLRALGFSCRNENDDTNKEG